MNTPATFTIMKESKRFYAFLAICFSLNWMKIISQRRKREYENDVFAIAMDWHKFEIHKQLQLQPDTNIQK